MSSNVIICPKKWFSDEGGMSANRGKAGQKEICDKKKEKRYVWQEKEQAEQTMRNHAERRELKPPVFSWLLLFLRKDSCETYTPNGTCGISWGMRYAFLNIRYFYPCVTSVAVCHCNRFSNRIWIAAAFFFVKIFHGEAARKIFTKKV